ncbi:hypothetical protein CDD82_374 [Ophiocordyceps australis]|uniref:Polyketide synthase-like phosphopantetheine-binding domain-containing protein n=1 Tax=Ophiocordyceps australis TaxID=1399860 RepID=A0A2C5XDP6_9HYPO|nr:hypothetical protein CDD82_374 [Ophiocordyceps australis]
MPSVPQHDYGKRLLPQVVDWYARHDAAKIYACLPRSATDLASGFQDIDMAMLAAMVNRMSWHFEAILGRGNLESIAYLGPADIRYAVFFLAAVKTGYQMLFISPRNQSAQNQRMLVMSSCKALLYAQELSSAAEPLATRLPGLVVQEAPLLDDLVATPLSTRHYPYDKTFDEARDDPCLILHSSGSTGDPKLVTMTHGTFSVVDNDRTMAVPEGRVAQNAARFDFEGGGKFYSCFPPYHLAGVHAFIDLPIFYHGATVVFGPTSLPPSGYLLSEIVKMHPLRAFYVPPFIIEQWAAEPCAMQQAPLLDFVLYGGGPLSPQTGDRLSRVTSVCQMYGSLEVGQIQLLMPHRQEWAHMELNPYEEADMQPMGDGTYEMVLHQHPKFAARRCLWHNFPRVQTWRTGDLFLPHPSKQGLWRFHSRADDLVVLSSSHKLRPLEMETIIQGHGLVAGAIIVGQGKPEPLLIVEPRDGAVQGNEPRFIDAIWPIVEQANEIAPGYAQIKRGNVVVSKPDRPFIRAPKGSIVRKPTTAAYADEIEAAYAVDAPPAKTRSMDGFVLPGLRQMVRAHVEEQLPGVVVADSDGLFACGLDSMGCARLSRSLQKTLSAQGSGDASCALTMRMIYKYPSIEGLANVVLSIVFNRALPDVSIGSDTKMMKSALETLTQHLPARKPAPAAASPASPEALSIVLIGPRGSLGPHIVRQLLQSPRVAKIYCLNRGPHGQERMRALVKQRGLDLDVDSARLCFMPFELGKPQLGLSDEDYALVLESANLVIHNAWKVDFNWTIEQYQADYLPSVRHLVDFSAQSPRSPRIVFISSISSVQEWAAVFPTPVTEEPLESFQVASPLGYGQSKHVSERILAAASAVSGTPVTILRVGQIAGSTTGSGGAWTSDEWVPSLAAISRSLNKVPVDIPSIDWVPANLAAQAISELSLDDSTPLLRVYNIVNPKLSPWMTFVKALQSRLGDSVQTLTLAEWTVALVGTDPKSMSDAAATSSTKLLPFFQHLAQTAAKGVALQPRFETGKAIAASKTMADMEAIDERVIDIWLQQWDI